MNQGTEKRTPRCYEANLSLDGEPVWGGLSLQLNWSVEDRDDRVKGTLVYRVSEEVTHDKFDPFCRPRRTASLPLRRATVAVAVRLWGLDARKGFTVHLIRIGDAVISAEPGEDEVRPYIFKPL